MTDHGQRGFTILELMVSLLILALGLSVVLKAVETGQRASATSASYQEALSLARSHLAAVTDADLGTPEVSGNDGRNFLWSLRIEPTGLVSLPQVVNPRGRAPQATLYSVSVIVRWTSGNAARQVQLDTMRVASE